MPIWAISSGYLATVRVFRNEVLKKSAIRTLYTNVVLQACRRGDTILAEDEDLKEQTHALLIMLLHTH
jgi:hypothetical protein